MPPTKRATWEDIDQVDNKLKSDHRFDWLAGTHTHLAFSRTFGGRQREFFCSCFSHARTSARLASRPYRALTFTPTLARLVPWK